jgi:predicted membrane protein DUF2232
MLRVVLLVSGLGMMSLVTPWPWSALWLGVPIVLALTLLLSWRYGATAWAVPAMLGLLAVVAIVFPLDGVRAWHLLWLPAAAITGAWMGSREEGGGPTAGDLAWMHAPLLAAAFAVPLLPGLETALARVEARSRVEEQQMVRTLEGPGGPGTWKHMMEESLKVPATDRVRMLRFLTPNLIFFWMLLLAFAGRAFAARIATALRWPRLSRAPIAAWRLPDGALVPLLVGLALALFPGTAWKPGATLLLVQSVLGYSVQGIAVTQSLLLSRGVPPTFVLLLLVLLLAFTLPVFLPSLALLGLSDVWLDFRRLEPPPRGAA